MAAPTTFRALRVTVDDGRASRRVTDVGLDVLPDHDVTVRVAYSSLNYKDALSATGHPGVTRRYPHTPGIDAAGTVVASRDGRFAEGDRVLVTGFDLGMDTPGGFGELVRVPGDWLVPMPAGLDARRAMVLGTAGFTAALALDALQRAGVEPGSGPAVVTGASGGVGTLAVALLARAGYEVVASTGKASAHALLGRLGAASFLGREELGRDEARPMLKGLYAAGVDTVGGTTLANLTKQLRVGGAVAACGMVGGGDVALSVFPFILRGVALLGVDSQHAPMPRRVDLWERLAGPWRPDALLADPEAVREVGLEELEEPIDTILRGGVTGRVVVRVAGGGSEG